MECVMVSPLDLNAYREMRPHSLSHLGWCEKETRGSGDNNHKRVEAIALTLTINQLKLDGLDVVKW